MPWPKPKKNPATNNSNREILKRLDRIIELLEEIASPHQRVVEQLRNSHERPKRI
ncbi:hypothetical protein QM007_05475 [Rothia sp. SD9660Na]|uniref:hypothetical protein n=1 Tax=Rothia sp. SD9660Na TaxID=3047030 RepID=UPI0024B895AA|nr:hypothetical protein [Rothia sp. SD9660Na]WHS51411.1 hypothetical protein QM007_05475 [Rothia sp. SD9660Na]